MLIFFNAFVCILIVAPVFSTQPWLDGKHVVFGHVSSGMEVLKQIESFGSSTGRTTQPITIVDCGQIA